MSCIPSRERTTVLPRTQQKGREVFTSSEKRLKCSPKLPNSFPAPLAILRKWAYQNKCSAPLCGTCAKFLSSAAQFARRSPPPHTAAAEAAAAYLGVIELEVSHAASERAKRCAVCLSASRCFLCKAPHDQQSRLATNSPACVREAGGEQRAEFMHLLLERAREASVEK